MPCCKQAATARGARRALVFAGLAPDNGRMTDRTSARHALRTATADAHDAVDHVFSRHDLSDVSDYAAFLQAQAVAFLPVEDAIDRSQPARAVADWAERRRSDDLRSDLADLNAIAPKGDPLPPFGSVEALLGAIYVLEGSRLGGTMLSRTVPDAFPKRFLSGGHSSMWRSLLMALELNLVTGKQRETAIAAARDVFALFEKGARVVATEG